MWASLFSLLSRMSIVEGAVESMTSDSKGAGTGLLYDPLFLEHQMGDGHPETPERLRHAWALLEKNGLPQRCHMLSPQEGDTKEHVLRVHTSEHVAALEQRYPKSEPIAKRVTAGVLAAVDEVCQGNLRNAFCLSRPPGHHAENTGSEEGFCFYNHIAVAAAYARKKFGMDRILIVDWDYHHGNGTETAFYSDPGVLFFSSHDYFSYPGTGDPRRRGEGRGEGYNVNVHLGCGTKDQQIVEVYEKLLSPLALKYKPQLVLVSAGFDSRKDDLLGCFDVTDSGFVRLTRLVQEIADICCDGKMVTLLEGGYEWEGTASAVNAHVETLLM